MRLVLFVKKIISKNDIVLIEKLTSQVTNSN